MLLIKGGLSSPTGDYKNKITANHSNKQFSKRLYGNMGWICFINYAMVAGDEKTISKTKHVFITSYNTTTTTNNNS